MKLGIIGGSGLYEIDGVHNVKSIAVDTPFGKTSDEFITGVLDDVEIVFLPRHGKGHKILPGELNHKANIFAMKKFGVSHIISISAVGSLREELKPRDIVIVDQYFDRTKHGLEHTFFGNGIAAHISFADPVCPELRELLYPAALEAVKEAGDSGTKPIVHKGGTYINMEGPAFSTKAESAVYKSWGMDVIGMTNLAEAKLSREAEICYCTMAMVTDYDCWHPDHDHVTVEMIVGNLAANANLAKKIIKKTVSMRNKLKGVCICGNALSSAIITNPDLISNELKRRLEPIIGKYLPAN